MREEDGWVEREIDLFGRVCTYVEARFSLRRTLSSLSVNATCKDGWYFSQVPWHMVLDPTARTKAFLFMGLCQIVVVEGGIQVRDISGIFLRGCF